MLPEFLEDRAALYVSGALTEPERENFELVLEFHDEAKARVAALGETMTACALVESIATEAQPSAGLKARILADLAATRAEPEAVVVTGPDGTIQWVNAAFTDLCGFTLEELKGKKPGGLLQGSETDQSSVERIRASLRDVRACRETLVNYHKDGSRYVVDVRIAPVLDDASRPCWFVARERKVDEAGLRVGG